MTASWVHVLQTSHEIQVTFGGEHAAWLRKELVKVGPLDARDPHDGHAIHAPSGAAPGTMVFAFSAWNQEAIGRVLWRVVQIRYHDAIMARQEVMGEAGGGRAR